MVILFHNDYLKNSRQSNKATIWNISVHCELLAYRSGIFDITKDVLGIIIT